MAKDPQVRASRRRSLWQFVKFAFVGGSGVIVNMVATLVLNKLNGGTKNSDRALFDFFGANFSYSMFVFLAAFLVANLWNFQLNRTWTFQSSKHAGWWKEFWPFLAVGSVAMVVGMLLKAFMKMPSSPIYLPSPWFHEERGFQSREYWAHLLAILLTMPVNFIVNKVWTFAAVRGQVPPVLTPETDAEATPEAEQAR